MKSSKYYTFFFHLIFSMPLFAGKCCIETGQTCIDTIPVTVFVQVSNLDTVLQDISQIESFLCSKIDAISLGDILCASLEIISTQTISNEGIYQICVDIDGSLIIDADNVALDLNNREISNGIEILANHTNVAIENGTVRGIS